MIEKLLLNQFSQGIRAHGGFGDEIACDLDFSDGLTVRALNSPFQKNPIFLGELPHGVGGDREPLFRCDPREEPLGVLRRPGWRVARDLGGRRGVAVQRQMAGAERVPQCVALRLDFERLRKPGVPCRPGRAGRAGRLPRRFRRLARIPCGAACMGAVPGRCLHSLK